jgi:hypothetical protein
MNKKSKTFGLDPRKLADLLLVGSDTKQPEGQVTPDQERSELLRDRLGEAMPLDSSVPGTVPISPNSLCQALGVLGGKPIMELLQNPESDISLIECIKRYNHRLSKCTKSKAERDVAITLYYAAIACALVFHKKKITTFSFETLGHSFSSLVGKPWISTQLVVLFKEARKVCQSPSKVEQSMDEPQEYISEDQEK